MAKSNLAKSLLLGAGILLGANKFANAQTFNDPSYSIPNYIQSMKEENAKKGQLVGAKCFFSFNNQLYYLWGDGKVFSEKGESFLFKDGKFVSESGKIMPSEFNKEFEKTINIVNLKEKRDNARVVDYFSYSNPKTKENNVFMVFSDGSVGFKYGFYDCDKQGVFFDSNNNRIRDNQDIQMSDEFSKKFYEKLKDIYSKSKSGSPSSFVPIPLNPREINEISMQIEDYNDYIEKRDLVFQNEEQFKEQKNLEQRLLNLEKTSENIKTTNQEINKKIQEIKPYDDSKIKTELTGVKDEIFELKGTIKDIKPYDDSKIKTELTGVKTQIDELSKKVNSLETVVISQSLDLSSINNYDDSGIKTELTGVKDEIFELKGTIKDIKPYDDSKILEKIGGLYDKINSLEQKVYEPSKELPKNLLESGKEKTENIYDQSSVYQQQPSSIFPVQETKGNSNEQPKEVIIESKDKPNETVIESKGTQIQTIIGNENLLNESSTNNENSKEDNEIKIENNQTEKQTPLPKLPNDKLYTDKQYNDKHKNNQNLSFIIEPFIPLDKEGIYGFGLRTGILYDFDENVGLGVNVSFEKIKDKMVDSYTGPIYPGSNIFVSGQKERINSGKIGLNGELRIWKFLLGGGIKIEPGIEKTLEQILRKTENGNDEVLESNSNSVPYLINSINGYIGAIIPINENLSGRLTLGYENSGVGKDSYSIGLGASIKLGNKSKK